MFINSNVAFSVIVLLSQPAGLAFILPIPMLSIGILK